LSDAQYVIAREYGLAHWTELKQRSAADSVAVYAAGRLMNNPAQTTYRRVGTIPTRGRLSEHAHALAPASSPFDRAVHHPE
jgi:hypothetical protein